MILAIKKILSQFIAAIVATMVVGIATTNATVITVGFEDAVGSYTPTPGVAQNVKNEFSSLGFIFEDISDPSFGATLGKCGPGNGLVALFGFGNDFSGCGDTTPDLGIIFVDPSNPTSFAYTTSFSVLNTDGLLELTAYDNNGNSLGSTSNSSGTLSLSGIGQIARVTIISLDQDSTTMDDIMFEMVTPFNVSVPEPAPLALLGFGLLGLGIMRKRRA